MKPTAYFALTAIVYGIAPSLAMPGIELDGDIYAQDADTLWQLYHDAYNQGYERSRTPLLPRTRTSAEDLKIQGEILTNKYSEGLPANRHYGGKQDPILDKLVHPSKKSKGKRDHLAWY